MNAPTPRQLNNASNIAATAIPYGAGALTALEAFIRLDELKATARRTNRDTDHAAHTALHNAIWRAHKAAVEADLAAQKAAGYPEDWTARKMARAQRRVAA